MRFKIDWASLVIEGKFTVFALFYFVLILREIFQVQPPGGLYFLVFLFELFVAQCIQVKKRRSALWLNAMHSGKK